MIVNQNPFEGLVKVIVTLVILGVVMGLLITGMDWWPANAAAPAQSQPDDRERPDVFMEATASQSGARSQASREEALVLAATEDRLNADNAYRRQRQAQNLKLRYMAMLALVGAVGAGILVLAGALAARIIRSAGRPQAARVVVYDPWRDPDWRNAQIELAHRREIQARLAPPATAEKLIPANGGYRRLRIPSRNERNRLN